MLIDAHCHLEHLSENEIAALMEHLSEKRLQALIACGTNPADWDFYKNLSDRFPALKVCYGIHPLEITDNWSKDLDVLEKFVPRGVAVGEIGLDFHGIFQQKYIPQMKLQMKVFERQLRLAKKFDLPVVIHCRDAFTILKEILIYSQFPIHRVMFHCFVEDFEAAQWIEAQGGYVSYSGVLTFKKPGHTALTASQFPLDRIFVETDSPYLAPVPFRGKQNSPELVFYVAQKLAEIKHISLEDCIQITANNTRAFFRF